MTSMTYTNKDNLIDYFAYIQKAGKLRTTSHAQRWSRAVLKTFGINLDRGTKKKLAKALPADLADDLTRVFWLAHFQNSGLTQYDFLNQVSRRAGNSDPDFARYPVTAVFHQLKAIIGPDMTNQVAKSLSPEMRQMWEEA
ncbi:MAG: DUF2267 domain-containing protein [Ardenticatenaceae bacterium]|nr:DUF2267 domain-containing protein [Ardenticatenaceae bacterium]MCB9443562.1 DUF2267 domain-containing protein [Ardenticatenaceae bacterium]